MIISEYITKKFQTFGIDLSEADLLDISLGNDLNMEVVVTRDNHIAINVSIVKYIPNLLLRASSFTENKLSMSWDIKGMKDFYSVKCAEYGLEDKLTNKPKVTFWQ
ncbi:DUF6706 family protein [Bacteroides sp. 51]|uniref:DUF6706 family protein n=1 Tax=Bacteroides sp. 51 TaxID=2302938 RepID=UPI0013D392DD|nr:DUF6706 family protein [Bacteroides sp. 51]NDV81336.1 hypothetical protein [Bacteroides sp. 51]